MYITSDAPGYCRTQLLAHPLTRTRLAAASGWVEAFVPPVAPGGQRGASLAWLPGAGGLWPLVAGGRQG